MQSISVNDKILSLIPDKDIYHPADNVIRIRNTYLHLFENVQLRDEQLGLF